MDKLYVTGGNDYYNNETYCQAYDPETTKWTHMERMQVARSRHSCVVFAGKISVTGGNFGSLRWSVEAYDLFENKWSHMPGLIEYRSGHGSVAMGNKLYVIGGIDTQSCEVFDYISNKFILIRPMPLKYDCNYFKKLKISFFRLKDKILVKYDSEYKEVDNIYIYDTKEDKWSSTSVEYFKENSCKVLYF